MKKTIPVILAGGIGERFWPMSRSSSPKQLHAIGSDRSMLEETLARVRACCEDGVKPMLITGAGIAGQVVKALGNTADSVEIIAEPQGKNTAPAIAIAAAVINERYGGGAVMAVVSADHAIRPVSGFTLAVERAVGVARSRGGLVVFGIKPSRPETGYGYIELGEQLQIKNDGAVSGNRGGVIDNIDGNTNDSVNSNVNNNGSACAAFKVKRFVEKPDAENAVKFMESGNFLWNSGMFVWTAAAILDEFHKYMPDLYNQAMDAAKKNFSPEAIDEFYSVCCKESIDFGIMEKAENVSAVCGDFFWDDLGSWESLSRVYESNELGTTVTGQLVYERDCAGSLIVNKSPRTVAAVGLKNVAVIAVDDALMVIDRSRLPDLKKYLAEIKGSGRFPAELF
jgi:mannose-1-phosphate guanylyltransferase